MAQILIQQPSKINNLGYFLLGFYIASLTRYNLDLTLEQQIPFIITFGGFIGTLVYYIKPIESCISSYFKLFTVNSLNSRITYQDSSHMVVPYMEYSQFIPSVSLSEIFSSNFLADDRTIINGIFFLSFGLVTSYPLLNSVQLSHYLIILQILAVLLFLVGIREIYLLIGHKMPPIIFLYMFYNVSKNIPELLESINAKDWIRSRRITEREPGLLRVLTWLQSKDEPLTMGLDEEFLSIKRGYAMDESVKRICMNCRSIIETGNYCQICGNELIMQCLNCRNPLIELNVEKIPIYCSYCGENIEYMYNWALDHRLDVGYWAEAEKIYGHSKMVSNMFNEFMINKLYEDMKYNWKNILLGDNLDMDHVTWDCINVILNYIPLNKKEIADEILNEIKRLWGFKDILYTSSEEPIRTSLKTYGTIIEIESSDKEIEKKVEWLKQKLKR